MAKTSGENPKNGLNDVIGIALLTLALVLLVAQLSFDRYDLSFVRNPPNKEIHNWIGKIGAYLAWFSFVIFGISAYLLPWISAAFGVAYMTKHLSYLLERVRWCLLWTFVLFISFTGLLHIAGNVDLIKDWSASIYCQNSGGGWLGYLTYGRLNRYDYGFCLLGQLGASIVYAALGLIAVLFLTNFQLGLWIRALTQKENSEEAGEPKSAEETKLEKRAQELEKQRRKLEEEVQQVQKTSSGLGADGLPVPEPTVRDLSYPQAKGPRLRKTTLPPEPLKEIAPATDGMEVGEVIHAEEIKPATTEDILGKKSADKKPVDETQCE